MLDYLEFRLNMELTPMVTSVTMAINMKWTIIYDNLSIVRGKGEVDFLKAPADGIQFIVWEDGRTFFDHNYYWYLNGVRDQTQDIGPLIRRLGIKCGRTTTDKNFEDARQLAIRELDNYGY